MRSAIAISAGTCSIGCSRRTTPLADQIPGLLAQHMPSMLRELELSYGRGNPSVAEDDGAMTETDRAWGLAPPRDYAAILAQTIEKDYKPRFAARSLVMPL
jgi:hypothetical protein